MKDVDGLLELLEKLEKASCESGKPSIADLSIAIEHAKYNLANIIKEKKLYLALINIILLVERNVYAFAGGVLENDYSLEKGLKDLRTSLDSFMTSLEVITKELLKRKED